MTTAKLFDLTTTNVRREMNLHRDGDPLVDPTFRRHVSDVTTEDQRKANVERLLRMRTKEAA